MRFVAVSLLLCLQGCLHGCMLMPQTANKLAGYTEPAFEMKTPSGWKVRVPTDADGKVKYVVNPDGSMTFELDLTSDASSVTGAQGERATSLVELRAIEAERIKAQTQMLTAMVGEVIDLARSIAPMLARPNPEPEPEPLPFPLPLPIPEPP